MLTIYRQVVESPAFRQRLRPIEDVETGPPARWGGTDGNPATTAHDQPVEPPPSTCLLATLHHHTPNP